LYAVDRCFDLINYVMTKINILLWINPIEWCAATTSNDYATYYDSVRAELTVVFTKYDLMFGGQISHKK
jgi:hypothetical protein